MIVEQQAESINDGDAVGLCDLLACPNEAAIRPVRRLRLAATDAGLRCAACGRVYPIEEGIVRMLAPSGGAGFKPALLDLPAREMRARDARAPEYDGAVPQWIQAVETEAVMRRLDLRPGHVVLDAGAGTGKLTHAAAAAGGVVVAVDFSLASLAINGQRADPAWTIHLVTGDVTQLPVRPEAFDRVISAQVIEHLPSPESRQRAVALMSRALKPGGRLVLTAYNYTLVGRFGGAREGLHAGEIFFHRFTAGELRALFDGLEIEELCGIRNLPAFAGSGPAGLASRLDHLLERCPWSRLTGDLLLVAARKP